MSMNPSGQHQQSAEQIQRQRDYLKQQQKLRLMASSSQNVVSADTYIENLLSKKDTFRPVDSSLPMFPSTSSKRPVDVPHIASNQSQNITRNQQVAIEWLSPSSPNFPALYRSVWSLVGQPDGMVDTEKVFPLLLTSGLPTDVLGYIWGLVNQAVAGKLTENELYGLLALVALAQRGYSFNSVLVLSQVPQPPIPNLTLVTEPQVPSKMRREELNLQSPAFVREQQIKPVASHHIVPSPDVLLPLPSQSSELQSRVSPISDFDDFSDFQCASTPKSTNLDSFSTNNLPSPKNSLEQSPPPKQENTETSLIPEPAFIQKFPTINVLGGGRSIGSRLANHSLGASKTSKMRHHRHHHHHHHRNVPPTTSPALDDDFSDFQQAGTDGLFSKCAIKPPPTNSHLLKESAIRVDSPVVDEIVATKPMLIEDKLQIETNLNVKTQLEKSAPPVKGSELMAVEEDRYGALRALSLGTENLIEQADDLGDFFSAPVATSHDSFADLAARSNQTALDNDIPWATNKEVPEVVEFQLDDWGSFASSSASLPSNSSLIPPISEDIKVSAKRANETMLVNSISCQLTDLTLVFSSPPISESKIPVQDVVNLEQDNDDDFGDFVGPDSFLAEEEGASVQPENSSWLEEIKEVDSIATVNSLWLDDTKSTVDQLWMEDPSLSKTSKEGTLDNHLLNNLWLEESKGLDNQSVSSLELPGMDQVWDAVGEWRKCLQSCVSIFQFAVDTLEAILEPSILQEVLSSNEGHNYLKDLIEVWSVCERLSLSYRQSGNDHKLDALFNSAQSMWILLKSYYTQAQINPVSTITLEGSGMCSMCLVGGATIEFESQSYHPSCANLWLNTVDSVLPALHLPTSV